VPSLPDASLIRYYRHQDGTVQVALVRDLAHGLDAGAQLVAVLAPDYLWGRRDEFDQRSTLCVLGPGGLRLFCSNGRLDPYLRPRASGAVAGAGNAPTPAFAPEMVQRSWDLFVGSAFRAESWRILQAAPEADLLQGLRGFQDVFLRFLLLTLLLVALVSVYQIRRSFTPLTSLMEGIRRIGRGEFDNPIAEQGPDEFGALAQAFNRMGERISRQLQRLTALSQIDRGILSRKSPSVIIAQVLRVAPAVSGGRSAVIAVADRTRPDRFTLYAPRRDASETVFPVRGFTLNADERTALEADGLFETSVDSGRFQSLLGRNAEAEHGVLRLAPVRIDGQLAAILTVVYGSRAAVSVEDREVLRELADRVAVALSNAAWEEKLQHLAYHDPLTGLPNRLLLTDRLGQALARARRSGGSVAVIFIDLDRFKTVNDSLGHSVGDVLLRHIARVLGAELRAEDTLARMGGDEFVALVTDLTRGRTGSSDAASIARKLQAAVASPWRTEGREIRATASLGIALSPDDGTQPETLLKSADAAMYHAKSLGRGSYQFYTSALNRQALERLDMEADLHRALENGEFRVYFQPKVDVAKRRIRGLEALLRWEHPRQGLIAPGKFIELAEETGIIIAIGRWVLHEALRLGRELARLGFEDLTLAVNVSPRQFREPGLTDQVRDALTASGFVPQRLELEITEGSAVENVDRALNVLEGFRELGARISIDDFGVGYASLSYMKLFPVDTLKIDRSFVTNLGTEPKDTAIVVAAIRLAHQLGLTIVAEGVETEQQLGHLQSCACDQAQGYLFSRPLPFDDLVALLSREQ
jgi:diguanylate cyclase (GGDEF)-like protein